MQMAQVTLTSNIPELIALMESRAAKAVDETLNDFSRMVVELFQQPKSGIFYRRPGRQLHAPIAQGVTDGHRASAPGEPPAIDYGNLVSSFESKKETAYKVYASIGGPRAPYAVALELGSVRMAPRPYWAVAVERVRSAWDARVAAIIEF